MIGGVIAIEMGATVEDIGLSTCASHSASRSWKAGRSMAKLIHIANTPVMRELGWHFDE